MTDTKDIFERALAKEIQGDASNFKGTDYHLLYVLWLVIVDGNWKVAFFKGNDLHAARTHPPSPALEESCQSATRVLGQEPDIDTWVQLKATQANWSVSALLDEHLLKNFIFNSLVSEREKRGWEIRLVTTSSINRDDIESFVKKPSDNPKLEKKLDSKIDEIAKTLAADNLEGIDASVEGLRQRALKILGQIARLETVHREVLSAQISERIMQLVADSSVSRQIQQQAYGAILKDALECCGEPRTYDREWLIAETGVDFSRFDSDAPSILTLCDEQVAGQTSRLQNDLPFVKRAPLLGALEGFLQSDSTVFLLTGRSGTGKSFSLHGWLSSLPGRTRILVPAANLLPNQRLTDLVAKEIPSLEDGGDGEALKRILLAANSQHGPLVIVLDDLRPPVEDRRNFRSMIREIARHAANHGIKLVMSCQTDMATNLNPFSAIDRNLIFGFSRDVDDGTSKTTAASFTLSDFSNGEIDSLSRKICCDVQTARALSLRLCDPALSLFRAPSLLSATLRIDGGKLSSVPDLDGSVFQAMERKANSLLTAAATESGESLESVHETIECLLEHMWESHPTTTSRGKLMSIVVERMDDIGRNCLLALYRIGVLTDDVPEKFSDRNLWASVFSRYLLGCGLHVDEIAQRLDWQRDQDLVAQLVANSDSPIDFSESLICRDVNWCASCAIGLSYCSPNDVAIFAMLQSCSRLSDSEDVHKALGRFALRSPHGRRWLSRLFSSKDHQDQYTSGYALWLMQEYLPQPVQAIVRTRIASIRPRIDVGEWIRNRKDKMRDCLAEALQPLSNTSDSGTAEALLPLIESLKNTAESIITNDESRNQLAVHTDKLLQLFDSLRGKLNALVGEAKFAELLGSFDGSDDIQQARRVNASTGIAQIDKSLVTNHFLEVISTSATASILSRVLWESYHVLETDSQAVFDSILSNRDNIFASFESTAAAFTLLVEMAELYPQEVLELVSCWALHAEPGILATTSDLACMLLHRCRSKLDAQANVDIAALLKLDEKWDGPLELHRVRTRITLWLLDLAIPSITQNYPLIHRIGYRKYGSDYFMPYLRPWVEDLSQGQLDSFSTSEIRDLLISLTTADKQRNPDPLNKLAQNISFTVQRDCIGALVEFVALRPEDWATIKILGESWQQLFAAKLLLRRGIQEEGLVEFTLVACERKHHSSMPQGSSERTECLALIAKFAPDRVPTPEHEKKGISQWFSGGTNRAKYFAAAVDSSDKGRLLPQLEIALKNPSELITLRCWHQHAEKWNAITISRLLARMFEFDPIRTDEAKFLLNSYIAAVEALPDSEQRAEHLSIYKAILARFSGEVALQLPNGENPGPLHGSHQLAAKIISLSKRELTQANIQALLTDRRGWIEDDSLRLCDDGTLIGGFGTNHYVVGFFPAVRLAFTAIASEIGGVDIAVDWSMKRRDAEIAAKKASKSSITPGEWLDRDIADLVDCDERCPDQDAIKSALGLLYLTAGNLDLAAQMLNAALSLPACGVERRSQCYCNLACVYAQKEMPAACEEALQNARLTGCLRSEWLGTEKDLDQYRAEHWFTAIVDELRG